MKNILIAFCFAVLALKSTFVKIMLDGACFTLVFVLEPVVIKQWPEVVNTLSEISTLCADGIISCD